MSDIESLTAGVDWVTMTLTDDCPLYGEWRRDCTIYLEKIAKEGYKVEERALMGYLGFGCGNSFFGTLDNRSMLVLSGAHADEGFYSLYRDDAHYSRIDLQITTKLVVMDNNRGRQHDDEAILYNDSLPKSRQRNIRRMSGSDGGYTLYIGAPTSEQMGRIYNKEVQSEDTDYERSWRYEVVLRNRLCDKWREAIHSAGVNARPTITTIVAQWYTERGVSIPFNVSDTEVIGKPISTIRSDDERKLRWLATQVVPTINYLADRGYEYDLRELFYRITNDSHYPSCPREPE